MSNAVMPLSDYVNACDTIREKTNSTDTIKSGELANKIDEVYEAGKVSGGGGDDYYNEFWDSIYRYIEENKGGGTEYLFMGRAWNDTTFKPPKDIVLTQYSRWSFQHSGIKNLKACLDDRGIKIDFTNALHLNNFFDGGLFEHIGEIDLSTCVSDVSINNMLAFTTNLVTVDKVKIGDNVKFHGHMQNCGRLQNITFEGELKASFNVGWSALLSKSSIQNIFSCLSNTATEQTLTLSKTAVNNAFETSSGLADGSTSQEWLNLVATKTNWTISLV